MTNFTNLRWKIYNYYYGFILLWGIKRGFIRLYDEELIEKLRGIYYNNIPASVLLLCKFLTNGKCYDRAFLMSKAFLRDDGDVNIVCASIADLRLNPTYLCKAQSEHYFVERITKDGKHYIYDTSDGLRYEKWIYWLANFPKVKSTIEKDSIKDLLTKSRLSKWPFIDDDFILQLIIPTIEANYGKVGETYSAPGIELLQRETELFKQKVISRSLN